MWTDWQAAALAEITRIHREMPDATIDELRKALRRNVQNFHMGTSWGKKTWGKRCRSYLLSLSPDAPKAPPAPGDWPDDIFFPFRETPNG